MYVDEIRAYTPQNEQEAADQRLILEYIRLFPDNILTRDNEIAHLSSSGFVVNADGTRVPGRRRGWSISAPSAPPSPPWTFCPYGAT